MAARVPEHYNILLLSRKARQVIMMRCRFAWICMYVCMYIHKLHNAILCLCMYIRNTCAIQSYARVCMSVTLCTMLAQFSSLNVPPGSIMAPDFRLACVACILWTNTTTSVSSPCPAHCASCTISVTLWRYALMFAECVALWTIRFNIGVV